MRGPFRWAEGFSAKLRIAATPPHPALSPHAGRGRSRAEKFGLARRRGRRPIAGLRLANYSLSRGFYWRSIDAQTFAPGPSSTTHLDLTAGSPRFPDRR